MDFAHDFARTSAAGSPPSLVETPSPAYSGQVDLLLAPADLGSSKVMKAKRKKSPSNRELERLRVEQVDAEIRARLAGMTSEELDDCYRKTKRESADWWINPDIASLRVKYEQARSDSQNAERLASKVQNSDASEAAKLRCWLLAGRAWGFHQKAERDYETLCSRFRQECDMILEQIAQLQRARYKKEHPPIPGTSPAHWEEGMYGPPDADKQGLLPGSEPTPGYSASGWLHTKAISSQA